MPRTIRLEASSHCQLKCPSCPTTDGSSAAAIAKGVLRPADFRRLLDENPWIREIEISNYGEIFLNPWLIDILMIAHERGIELTAYNGVNLNHVRPNVLEAIVKYRLRAMTCSIDGASPETYSRYRVRGDFERVIANIRAINALKLKYRSSYPILVWQFIVFGHNEHEIEAARALAESLQMVFRLKLSWDPEFSPIRDQAALRGQPELPAISRAEFEAKYQRDYAAATCHQLWDAPQLNWDGTLLGCCRNFWGDFGPNAYTHGLRKVLNGEKMRYARAMLRGEMPSRADVPCTTCEIYQGMAARNVFLPRGLAHRAGMRKFFHVVDRLSGYRLAGVIKRAVHATRRLP